MTGRSSISDLERDWLTLPNGGLGLVYLQKFSKQQNQASRAITQPLVQCLRNRCKDLSYEVWKSQERLVSEHSKLRSLEMSSRAKTVRETLPCDCQRLMDVASERGASVWLSALPIKEHGYDLHKGSFQNVLCIRYGWQPLLFPSIYICGTTFALDHSLSCPYGGFTTL